MAKKTKKEKEVGNLNYKIDKEKDLLKEWKDHNISQTKIDKMEAKQAKHEVDLAYWESQ